jgi:hypothetical protein
MADDIYPLGTLGCAVCENLTAFYFLGNKIFSFVDQDVDFYLPQLVSMYIQMHDVAEVLHPYLVQR